ncbi:MAG TPA: SMP-30/gluconolactonase/LRE family protein [Anaerolineae bacterium]|nr:SMP-30/gluconolactonase/LRE family protein [Anaerolineae bacterium]
MLKRILLRFAIFGVILLCTRVFAQTTPEGTAWVNSHSYSGCIQLLNKTTKVYTIQEDGMLSNRRLFAPEGDDGMTMDEEGNVYLTGSVLSVYDPSGNKIETIEVPETPANVIFMVRTKISSLSQPEPRYIQSECR